MSHDFLHGDGRNRWFDKSFSVIVTENARAGVSFEHSWGDGVAVLRYFNDIYRDTTSEGALRAASDSSLPSALQVRPLNIEVGDYEKESIEKVSGRDCP